MKFLKFLNEAKKEFVAYHNTDSKSYDNIISNGFKLNTKIKRKKLYGKGIYFSETPNPRWGDKVIKVIITPKNPLLDREGDLIYEDTKLGSVIEEYGKKLFPNFKMTNNKLLSTVIESYLSKNKHDLLLTMEYDKVILVVREPSIINIINLNEGGKWAS